MGAIQLRLILGQRASFGQRDRKNVNWGSNLRRDIFSANGQKDASSTNDLWVIFLGWLTQGPGGIGDGLGTVTQTEFGEHAAHMVGGGLSADQ